MTVYELIAKLYKFPPDTSVVISDTHGGWVADSPRIGFSEDRGTVYIDVSHSDRSEVFLLAERPAPKPAQK